MKLSIIVPVFNMVQDGKLDFCMQSLVNQTISDYEIIAVDDKSTDNSLEVLKEWEKKYPQKVKVIASPENRKQGGAKNLGLKKAAGEWIGFVDSDDWVAADMYEKLLNKAEQTGADIVGCNYSIVYEHTFQQGKCSQNNSLEQTGIPNVYKHRKMVLDPGSMVIKIYHRDIFMENNIWFPEQIFYEDNAISAITMLSAKQFEKVEECLYYYYQHSDSTVHTISEERCRHRMKASLIYLEECKKRGFYDECSEEVEYKFFELFYKNTLFSYMQACKRTKLSFVKELKKGLLTYAPDFVNNKYYLQYTDKENKKLIQMHVKSDIQFYVYYKLLYLYRRIRYGK